MKRLVIVINVICVLALTNQVYSSGRLTYTFDDGGKPTLDAFNILSAYNQIGVSGPHISGTLYAPQNCMSPQELLMLQTGGWEIASHSVSHPLLTQIPLTYNNELLSGWSLVSGKSYTYKTTYSYPTLPFVLQDGNIFKSFVYGGNLLRRVNSLADVETNIGSYFFDSSSQNVYLHTINNTDPSNHSIIADSAERELHQSKVEFEQMGLRINTVILPYGNWNTDIINLAKNYYDATVPGIGGYNDIPLVDQYYLKRLNVLDNAEVNTMKAWVEQAIANNDWLILMFHNIGDNFFSKEKFEEFASWVSLQDIDVITIREGITLTQVSLPAGFLFMVTGLTRLGVYAFRRKMKS